MDDIDATYESGEAEIFSKLEELCASPGYIHAIAFLVFQDITIKYYGKLTSKNILAQFNPERLSKTEISALIGLACKSQLNFELPAPDVTQKYINKTQSLLEKLHHSMIPTMNLDQIDKLSLNPLNSGFVWREVIFYGGDSAYHFQYRDLSKIRYKKDNKWLINNKGYTINQAIDVVASIQSFQNKKTSELLGSLEGKHPSEWSLLESYTFTVEEIANLSCDDVDIVRNVVDSFVAPLDMEEFNSIDDFNPKNAYPIIKIENSKYLLFQYYSLAEALYETPFFWFYDDKQYRNNATRHRGEFTEEFSTERLMLVFGKNHVFQNVDIVDSKKNKAGEIDVLVVFGNRAIVLQAKSKKLTIEAKKGNIIYLQKDFKKAVQDAYDQAYKCSLLLTNNNYKLIDKSGDELNVNRDYKEIYPFCVVSDHYPSLSSQVREFLEFNKTEKIKPPFVMDVFFLDVMTEMLQSPLYLLSYVNRRTLYEDKIYPTKELTILSYHLKQNLWIDDKNTLLVFEENISADLDVAMFVRRNGVDGVDIPEGILTKFKGSFFDQIIKAIDKLEHSSIIDFGFMLLTFSEDFIEMINDGIAELINLVKKDGRNHDLAFIRDRTGLTIHCNDDDDSVAISHLRRHCELRKYKQKADRWFGICFGSINPILRFGVTMDSEWIQSNKMDKLVEEFAKGTSKPINIKGNKKIDFQAIFRKSKKVGRNEICPCGSGKKYKKCCLHKKM